MKTIHYELWYKNGDENNWYRAHSQIRDKECVDMDVERKYAKERFNAEAKLVRVETTVESFDELV